MEMQDIQFNPYENIVPIDPPEPMFRAEVDMDNGTFTIVRDDVNGKMPLKYAKAFICRDEYDESLTLEMISEIRFEDKILYENKGDELDSTDRDQGGFGST